MYMISFNLDTVIPVTRVQLGEPATFTCVFPKDLHPRQLQWYKQSAGDSLKTILAIRKHARLVYGESFPASRLEIEEDFYVSNLTILKTQPEDEGIYHCAIKDWFDIMWSGTSPTIVVQWLKLSSIDPFRPGDSVPLHCSVPSGSQSKTYGIDESYPSMMELWNYRWRMSGGTQKSCVYHFSKKLSSVDAGTYSCAVVTCGEMSFGNVTRLDIQGVTVYFKHLNCRLYMKFYEIQDQLLTNLILKSDCVLAENLFFKANKS
uniref:Ig-like domain-containing protein n=1 Tax=Mola mola TaxID=94237 RepID=A0A3Q3W1F2_MOLML